MEPLLNFILNPPNVVPELIVKVATTVLFITISLVIFYILAIKPIRYFIYKKLNKTNRLKSQLLLIINSDNEIYKSFNNSYIEELEIIEKMRVTECLNRKLALYFYGLTNISNHMISYNKFKRIYPYLSVYNGEYLIDYKRIKLDNRRSLILASSLFLLMGIFTVLLILLNRNWLLFFTFIAFFEVLGLLALDMKIKKNEINVFIETESKYRNELQSIFNEIS